MATDKRHIKKIVRGAIGGMSNKIIKTEGNLKEFFDRKKIHFSLLESDCYGEFKAEVGEIILLGYLSNIDESKYRPYATFHFYGQISQNKEKEIVTTLTEYMGYYPSYKCKNNNKIAKKEIKQKEVAVPPTVPLPGKGIAALDAERLMRTELEYNISYVWHSDNDAIDSLLRNILKNRADNLDNLNDTEINPLLMNLEDYIHKSFGISNLRILNRKFKPYKRK